MASKQPQLRTKKLLAKVATDRAPCGFCNRAVDDEQLYGKLYVIGDIYCHYFCVLLSCCLIQKGNDEEGLFGFLYTDILAEIKRSKKHKCSYCNKEGATLGCSISQCRKQFHLPCGREKNAVSIFHGNYKSFCQHHVPKQKIPDNIMENIIERKRKLKKLKQADSFKKTEDTQEIVCVICYEAVDAFPTINTFWPPCCSRDAWFHRSCLQRMALSAGIHYLKCPLCNDKQRFYDALLKQGYYVPDRDASWELENNAFADLYVRQVKCSVTECVCPSGREHDLDNGPWNIKLCLLCGIVAAHPQCASIKGDIYVCSVCLPAAPSDPKYLEAISAMSLLDPNPTPRAQQGPRMPSRMSIRRTKPRLYHMPTSSIATTQSHQEGHTKAEVAVPKRIESDFGRVESPMSPVKMLRQQLSKLDTEMLNSFEWDSNSVIESVRQKLEKPRPLSVKKKIISCVIEDISNKIMKEKTLKELTSSETVCNVLNDVEMINVNEESDLNDIAMKEERLTEKPPTPESDIKAENNEEKNLDYGEANNNSFSGGNQSATDAFEDTCTKDDEMGDKNSTIILSKDKMIEENSKIGDDSMGISPNRGKSNEKENQKIYLKFSPKKEVLSENVNIDVEIFKRNYLKEVSSKKFNKIIPPIEETSKSKKKISKASVKKGKNRRGIEKKYRIVKRESIENNLDRHRSIGKKYTYYEPRSGNDFVIKLQSLPEEIQKKPKTKLSIRSKKLKLKIKWERLNVKLKISKSDSKKQKLLTDYFTVYD